MNIHAIDEKMLRSIAIIYLNTKKQQLQQRNENIKETKAEKKMINKNDDNVTTVQSNKKQEIE